MITTISLAGLLHDIGKVVQRSGGQSGTHSEIGYEWLKNYAGLTASNSYNKAILHSVRYHHSKEIINSSSLSDNSIAYIVYEADNIASGADRRAIEGEPEGTQNKQQIFDRKMPLESIFNFLKGRPDENDRRFHYLRGLTEN